MGRIRFWINKICDEKTILRDLSTFNFQAMQNKKIRSKLQIKNNNIQTSGDIFGAGKLDNEGTLVKPFAYQFLD